MSAFSRLVRVAGVLTSLLGLLSETRSQTETGIIARSRLTVDGTVQGKTAVAKKGEAASLGTLPRLPTAKKTTATRALAIEGSGSAEAGDFASTKDVTLNYTFQPVSLPPGTYGRLVVQGSRVVLGEAGAMRPARYDFAAIEVIEGGRIDLVGPVIVTTDGFDKLDGVIGRADLPAWLDLRISERSLTVSPKSQVYGSVYAPASQVRVQSESRVDGWIVGDDVRVDRGGQVTAMRMPWSPAAATNPHLAFPQRALLVQERLGRFVAANPGQLSAELDFSTDVPRLTLAGNAGRKSEKPEPQERQWFFQACSLLFVTEGLEQANLLLQPSSVKEKAKSAAVEVSLTRSDFEALVWAVGGEKIPGEGIRKIEADPLLQTLFYERSLRLHRVRVAGKF